MSRPGEPDFLPPIVTDDALRIAPVKASVKKARASESNVVWAVVALLGVTGMFYALRVARQPAPVPVAAPVAARKAVPSPRPVARPRTTTAAPTPRFRDTQPAPSETVATIPAAEKVATVGEAARRTAVDPLEGFDTGAAFDNPPSPGRYGQRTSGLLERMPAANNSGTRDRPNAPDPSFRPRR